MNSKEDKKYIMYITDNKADTVTKFRATTFSESEMMEVYNRANYNSNKDYNKGDNYWAYNYWTRKILLHNNCPKLLREKYANHKLWYVRLVAMLAKPAREQYAELALFDESKNVRVAAMRSCSGALYNQASQDNLVDSGDQFFKKKKKEIEQNPTLALLDPYETFRKMATQKLQGLK